MAHTKPLILDPLATRQKLGLNQTQFWGRLDITQSAGSRYESGRKIPRPVRTLMAIAYGTLLQCERTVAALRESTPSKD